MPSFIAISETKLSDGSTINISLEGYALETKHSPANAGRVGIYVKENIEFTRRRELEFDFEGTETCFLKIPKRKGKEIIVACIYRHPSSNIETFHQLLCKTLENINRSGYEAYLTGDINVNLHAYSSHKPTSDYLDMLFNLGYLSLITKATRITDNSKTLIGHIYTNCPEKVRKSGICLADISDHLPCFCTFSSKLQINAQQKYYRDFSNFNSDLFIEDLDKVDFLSLVEPDVNKSMINIANTLQHLSDKHAPIKKATNRTKRVLNKPWITKGILISIKKRHKLFKSHFLSSDPEKIQQYKPSKQDKNKCKTCIF